MEPSLTNTADISAATPAQDTTGRRADRDGPAASDATGPGRAPFRPYRDGGKRVLDLVLVLASGLICVPLILLLAVLIARDGHSPFFRQRRVGRNGELFDMLKLRTMVPDAEARLRDIVAGDPEAAQEWHVRQKLRRDPRVTRIGAFLRRTSLDELPQLWNVLRGDMALVGPRPMMPNQRELYPGSAYYLLRPGITGLWQVSERNHDTFAGRAAYDELYAAELTLWLDLKTLARTVKAVARGTGC
jgi:lipopolysaccharide/colanic/teichoic acid biosynthesis glycosyltransferase